MGIKTFSDKLFLLIPLFILGCKAQQTQGSCSSESLDTSCAAQRYYTFSWSMSGSCLKPRGGTTKGTPTTLDPNPHPGWLAIQEPGLSKFEKDRRAILAMAGPYRTSFDFLEILGFSPDYQAPAPYQSWGTEYIYVVEEREDFISLQHIMVMFMELEGKVVGPMVMKHWRQDWQYEKAEILAFVGNRSWELQDLGEQQSKGTWAQAVYQVDDTPRYESFGTWHHFDDFSEWKSAMTWRPLPRREFSVRQDYQVLEGTNQHIILRNGWVHQQENLKRVLSENSEQVASYLAKELGVNRYERIIDHDFSAGDQYWAATQAYWQIVRESFAEIIRRDKKIALKKSVNETPLFVPLFDYAQKLADGAGFDLDEANSFVTETIAAYLK